MSAKAIGVAVVVLVFLIALAVWLSGGGAPAPAPATPLLAFDPARVSAIEVTDARGTHRVRREPSGEWIYDGGFAWPALIPADAQRALGELSSLERSDEAAGDEAPASTLRLRMDDGSERAIEALPGSLGGMTTIRVRSGEGSPGAGRIATTTLNALIDPGPAGWRAPMAAPGASDASRITVTDPARQIALARLDGRWSMRRPVTARADHTAVDALLGALAEARVQRFEDAPPGDISALGLEKPALIVEWEIDQRVPGPDGEVRVQTQRRQLRIGGPADPQGASRFASPGSDLRGLMVVSASTLTSISTAARSYLAPTVTGVRPEDVFMLTISPVETDSSASSATRAYRRSMGAWIQPLPDGGSAPADADAVERLLEFLSARPGETEPAHDSADIRELLRIDLFDLDGDPLDVLIAGYNADGTIAFRSQNLVTTFPGVTPPDLLQLPAFASLPAAREAPPPVSLPEGAPVGK